MFNDNFLDQLRSLYRLMTLQSQISDMQLGQHGGQLVTFINVMKRDWLTDNADVWGDEIIDILTRFIHSHDSSMEVTDHET